MIFREEEYGLGDVLPQALGKFDPIWFWGQMIASLPAGASWTEDSWSSLHGLSRQFVKRENEGREIAHTKRKLVMVVKVNMLFFFG